MRFWQFSLVGLSGVAVIIALLYFAGENRIAKLHGEITSVRSLGVEKRAAVAIVDFRAANLSDVLFVAGDRKVGVIDKHGEWHEGIISSSFDLKQLFKYFPALGVMSHEPYVEGIRLKPGQSVAGMLAARFAMSKTELDMHREVVLQIYDIDGSLTEFNLERLGR